MESALEKEGVRDPRAWLRRTKGNLDQALAETVTRAVNDVLLDRLLAKLDGVPLANDLLLGAAVYRIPVDVLGLAWQVAEEIEIPGDRERKERIRELSREINRARGKGEEPSPDLLARHRAELPEWRRPPLAVPAGFPEALELLGALGLLAPVQWSDTPEDARFAVHRWTASAVRRRSPEAAVRQAHHRAARHWRWRADRLPQSRQDDIAQLLEARHHYREAGDVDQAVGVTDRICEQLDTWGAYRREEQLCRETLTWLPERSTQAAAFLHRLGVVAQQRGAYEEALGWYKRSLPILEELGDRAKMAISYHQLGMVAQKRGAYEEAVGSYKRSLQIDGELGNRAGMAISYHQLGVVAQERGAYEVALGWYKRSLPIFEELGNRVGMATSYGQLGVAAEKRGDYNQALDWFKRALQIFEELGDQAGMARVISQLGVLATEQGRPEEGLPLNLRSLAIRLELQVPEVGIDLHWLGRQRELLGEERFGELLREHAGAEGAEAVLGLMARFEAGSSEEASEPPATGQP
jgi:tetratricopeptide (TPR) repeat protein